MFSVSQNTYLKEAAMPAYEFTCQSWGKVFSLTTSVKDLEQGSDKMPGMRGADDVEQQMAAFMSETLHKG
jgi:hypothetical protein